MQFVQCFECGLMYPRYLTIPVTMKKKGKMVPGFLCNTCKDIVNKKGNKQNEKK